MEIHLDLVGGLAGDMFIAAMLDAFPEYETRVVEAIAGVRGAFTVRCALHPFNDGVLQGRRFTVERLALPVSRERVYLPTRKLSAAAGHDYAHSHGSGALHVHGDAIDSGSWQAVQDILRRAALDDGTRSHALAIFELLAKAEAKVHGIAVDAVSFHEVGAWDSIADIVGAAALIQCCAVSAWSASPAPLGGGRVQSAHGPLPVPAPATAKLLLGLPTIDDGIAGERVTPTGAAILRYLCPPASEAPERFTDVRILQRAGTGFGTRVLPGISNHVRVLCFEKSTHETGGTRQMHSLEFEVDDQSQEDLALGLDRLRATAGVLDVTQATVYGKKNRAMTQVRVLARQSALAQVVDACFTETTTIGLRHRLVNAVGLERRIRSVDIEGQSVRVKVVERPGGLTAKAESDDLSRYPDHNRRASLRRAAESAALMAESEHGS